MKVKVIAVRDKITQITRIFVYLLFQEDDFNYFPYKNTYKLTSSLFHGNFLTSCTMKYFLLWK